MSPVQSRSSSVPWRPHIISVLLSVSWLMFVSDFMLKSIGYRINPGLYQPAYKHQHLIFFSPLCTSLTGFPIYTGFLIFTSHHYTDYSTTSSSKSCLLFAWIGLHKNVDSLLLTMIILRKITLLFWEGGEFIQNSHHINGSRIYTLPSVVPGCFVGLRQGSSSSSNYCCINLSLISFFLFISFYFQFGSLTTFQSRAILENLLIIM